MRRLALAPVLAAVLSGAVLTAPSAQGASPLWKVLSVGSFACDGATISYQTTDIPGPGYIAHTRAYVDGKLYMNENAGDMANETDEWGIYESDTYADGSLTGTWPMPAGKVVTVILELEQPKGTVVSSWKLNVSSCDNGTVVYNGLTSGDPDDDLVVGAADKCPTVKAARANGCPLIDRTVTLKYNAVKGNFAGKIKCAAFEFRQFKNVIVYRKQPGKDQKIGSSKTGFTAHFRVRAVDAKPGKYYAVVKKGLQADVGQVAKTKSKVLKLG